MSRTKEKLEDDLAMSIKKALVADDSGPKQKHVRAVILYTWDVQGSGQIWVALKSFPLLGDETVAFKALTLVHRAVRQGHPMCLKEGISERHWIEQLARTAGQGYSSYGALIRGYSVYILAKLTFHQQRPAFSGTFDYEEYVSLKGVDDPDEGYETIHDLLQLLSKLDQFQKILFANFKSSSNNEARISALVPLVEESYGIYQFIFSMMTAMHQIIGSVEVLCPLRDQFKQNHYALLSFYAECSSLKYLTTLVTVPQLSTEPPNFLGQGLPTRQPRNKQNHARDEELEYSRLQQIYNDQRRQEIESEQAEQRRMQMEYEQNQRIANENEQRRQMEEQQMINMRREQELQRLEQEQERFRQYQMQHEQQMAQSRMMDAQSQLEYLQSQANQDKVTIRQYNLKVNHLENQISQLSTDMSSNSQNEATVKRLSDEVLNWKQKYEALVKLYAELRKEHIELLGKMKLLKTQAASSEDVNRELERARIDLKAKQSELSQAILDKNRVLSSSDLLHQEIMRLKHENEVHKASLTDLSASKGAEVQELIARFTKEREAIESMYQKNLKEFDALSNDFQEATSEYETKKLELFEENQVLQAGLDQSLILLGQHQKNSLSGLGQRDITIAELAFKHQSLLDQMMDNVYETCISTLNTSMFEFESAGDSQKANPEHILAMIEKCQQSCSEFSTSVVRLANGGDPKDAIKFSSALAQSVGQFLIVGKPANALAEDAEDAEDILAFLRDGAEASINFFSMIQSRLMNTVLIADRPQYIINLAKTTNHQIGKVAGIIEKLVVYKFAGKGEKDLSVAVNTEMQNAANEIEKASARLALLMASQKVDVHAAILQSAIFLTTAIAYLIKCATDSQQEIVAKGKGSSTQGAYYKKNNKWTEGLISAAHSVAGCTTYLVETADGLVEGKNSLEQLVVAATETSVATTQLVAASRVKDSGKTQDRLEEAASSVRQATKLLVKAAKDAAQVKAQVEIKSIAGIGKHELKVQEMEAQVKILELEKSLQTARYQLGALRKDGYHQE